MRGGVCSLERLDHTSDTRTDWSLAPLRGLVAKTTRTAGTTGKSAKTATKSVKKHVGDVIGVGRARVPKDVPRATTDRGGRPKGIEIGTSTRPTAKRAGVVGGVRGRGR